MGTAFGKINVETPAYTVVRAAADGAYEIRRYGSSVAAEVRSADWAAGMTEREFSKVAFPTLARYIGVFGEGENVARGGAGDGAAAAPAAGDDGPPEKMAMTAPVVMAATDDGSTAAGERSENMAMTAPVVMSGDASDGAGAPAGSGQTSGFTMAFLLPSKYKSAAEAPRPTNDKVHLKDVPPRTVAVRKYSGNTTMGDCGEQVKGLLDALSRDGVATTGPWTLQRYNPPFSLPRTKTNEIHVPVDDVAVAKAAPEGADPLAAAGAA